MKRRPNNEGSIYFEQSRNCYKATLTMPDKSRKSKRFKTKQEASDWLSVTRAEIYKGEYIDPSDITLGDWLLEYIDTYRKPNIRYSSLSRYYSTAKKLGELSFTPLSKLTAHALQKFINEADLSQIERLKLYKLVKAAIRKAYVLGMMKDISPALEPPKCEQQKEIEIYTLEEIQRIITWVSNSTAYRNYLLFIRLAIITGARIGELLALKTENVHTDYIHIDSSLTCVAGKLIFSQPKTKAGNRNITIPQELAEELRKEAGDNVFIFHTQDGKVKHPNTIRRAWDEILKGANVPHKHFHAIRHTHATQLLANGVPILEVSKRLGHANASITLNKYGHAIKGYDKTLPQKIVSIFNI